jgi:hypothetical protein
MREETQEKKRIGRKRKWRKDRPPSVHAGYHFEIAQKEEITKYLNLPGEKRSCPDFTANVAKHSDHVNTKETTGQSKFA